MDFIIRFFATGFFVGYLPFAPGTVATLLALGIYLLLPTRLVLASARRESLFFYLLFISIFFFFGVYLSGKAEKFFRNKDNRQIVIDEMVGFFIALFLLPGTYKFIILAFLLYRFFDIVKFPFFWRVQYLPGGWGIMLDDFFAAVITNIVLQIFRLTNFL